MSGLPEVLAQAREALTNIRGECEMVDEYAPAIIVDSVRTLADQALAAIDAYKPEPALDPAGVVYIVEAQELSIRVPADALLLAKEPGGLRYVGRVDELAAPKPEPSVAVANLLAHLEAAAEDARRGTSGSVSIPAGTIADWILRLGAIEAPRSPLPEAVRGVAVELRRLSKSVYQGHLGALADRLESAGSAPPPAPVDREAVAAVDREAVAAAMRSGYASAVGVTLGEWAALSGEAQTGWLAAADVALEIVGEADPVDTPTARPEREQAEQVAACEELEAMLVPHAEPGESAPDTLRRLLGELRSLWDRLVPWHRGDGETYPALLSRLLAEVEAGRRASGARGVDVGAVGEVASELRDAAKEAHEQEHRLACPPLLHGTDWAEDLADRLDAALGGAGEGAPAVDASVLVPIAEDRTREVLHRWRPDPPGRSVKPPRVGPGDHDAEQPADPADLRAARLAVDMVNAVLTAVLYDRNLWRRLYAGLIVTGAAPWTSDSEKVATSASRLLAAIEQAEKAEKGGGE